MKIHECKQGSAEWKALRLGMITGTRLKDVFKPDNLSVVDDLIAERISDAIEDSYVNDAMKRGVELEPIARMEYELKTGNQVEQLGFCISNEYNYLGLSPDGLIKINGKYKIGIEIKCPNTNTHVRYIRMNKIPNEYKFQILNYFLVCQDLERVDFISFDDRFTVNPMHIITIKRNELSDDILKAKMELEKFWIKFEKYYNQVIFG